jgi:hypothetical protein
MPSHVQQFAQWSRRVADNAIEQRRCDWAMDDTIIRRPATDDTVSRRLEFAPSMESNAATAPFPFPVISSPCSFSHASSRQLNVDASPARQMLVGKVERPTRSAGKWILPQRPSCFRFCVFEVRQLPKLNNAMRQQLKDQVVSISTQKRRRCRLLDENSLPHLGVVQECTKLLRAQFLVGN